MSARVARWAAGSAHGDVGLSAEYHDKHLGLSGTLELSSLPAGGGTGGGLVEITAKLPVDFSAVLTGGDERVLQVNAPWQASGTIQNRGNVWIVQNPLPCLPCTFEGCERHIASASVCLEELSAGQVLAAVDQALAKTPRAAVA